MNGNQLTVTNFWKQTHFGHIFSIFCLFPSNQSAGTIDFQLTIQASVVASTKTFLKSADWLEGQITDPEITDDDSELKSIFARKKGHIN